MIAARMRHGEAWSDASILNISSRGLMLHAPMAPSRGTYIEVRRGQHVVIARVVWSNDNRFGVAAQDRVAIDAFIANHPPRTVAANDGNGPAERRSQPRPERLEWRHARSREKGCLMEFAFIAGAGLLVAAFAHEAIARTLSDPLQRITGRLAGRIG
jgi:hypothetical protein